MIKTKIRNLTNKKRSLEAMNELKSFSIEVAKAFGIDNKINQINLNYTKHFYGYYLKGKPMYGFHKLFHGKQVRIDFARGWDASQEKRKTVIIHEMTHVKQMIEGRLKVSEDFKDVKWKGVTNKTWRKFRFTELEKLDSDMQNEYLAKLLPWEKEVQTNINKFYNNNKQI